jgi:hypothetical protein
MKEWVRWFLVEENVKQYQEETERQEAIAGICEDLEDEEEVYDQLTDYFNVDFGRDEPNGPADYLANAFGSVLADLPQDVFQALCEMKNLFFTFTPHAGAEVKRFALGHDVKTQEGIQIVTFPYAAALLPWSATRGQIAHHLAHIYAGHKAGRTDTTRDEADKMARSWGFYEDIAAYGDYRTAQERSWGLKEKLRAYRDAYLALARTHEKKDERTGGNDQQRE